MPSNVEIKARIGHIEKFREIASEISQSNGTVLHQEDTFFHVSSGRLKLRQEGQEEPAKLIFYKRVDTTGPKRSDYSITQIHNPEDLKATLGAALGIVGVVKKTRWLYLVGQTRVHVDRVEGIGDFMELEVVLTDDQTTEHGQRVAEDLMKKLGVGECDLLEGAYMDLIRSKQGDQ